MKAIVYDKYGTPDVFELKEVEKPILRDNEVLIKVHAASINSSDNEMLRGIPIYTRMWGLFKPKYRILGSDIAGRIEAVGKKVTRFQKGDAVFGDIMGTWGGFSEYASASAKELMLKPENISFENAAALPQSAAIALQGLRDKGKIQPGQKVLINGAGGGAGSFAIQLARSFGAETTGVDNTSKLDTMQSLGANHVIDYTREDFTKKGEHYDLILDFVASHSIFDYKRALSPKGRYVMVGGSMSRIFKTLLLGSLISLISSRKMGILAARPNKGLTYILELIEAGTLKPVLDRCYPLEDTPEAFRYFQKGTFKGKIVITL